LQLANEGWKVACTKNTELRKGLNVVEGKVVYKGVAEAWGLNYQGVESVLNN
jgi:alanine dehydrogenase